MRALCRGVWDCGELAGVSGVARIRRNPRRTRAGPSLSGASGLFWRAVLGCCPTERLLHESEGVLVMGNSALRAQRGAVDTSACRLNYVCGVDLFALLQRFQEPEELVGWLIADEYCAGWRGACDGLFLEGETGSVTLTCSPSSSRYGVPVPSMAGTTGSFRTRRWICLTVRGRSPVASVFQAFWAMTGRPDHCSALQVRISTRKLCRAGSRSGLFRNGGAFCGWSSETEPQVPKEWFYLGNSWTGAVRGGWQQPARRVHRRVLGSGRVWRVDIGFLGFHGGVTVGSRTPRRTFRGGDWSNRLQVPARRASRVRRLWAPVLVKIDFRWSWTVCSDMKSA